MQRALLPTLLLVVAFLAGCAQNGDAPEAEPLTAEQAASLFAQAASNMPERYGMDMQAVKGSETLMEAQALYDGTADTAFFHLQMDPTLTDAAGDESGMMIAMEDVSIYTTPEGTAVLTPEGVLLAPPGDTLQQMAGQQDGLDTITDPSAFFEDMEESGLNITSVTPDTLRGKAASKIEGTVTEEGQQVPITLWIYQDPARVARVVMDAPATSDGEDPFAGATMTLDMLYDDEVEIEVPAGLTRAMGLRYTSDQMAFDFGESSSSSDEDDAVTWTFEVDGGIALSEVRLQVDDEAFMTLNEGTKTANGMTATYTDADNDGKVSAGDTLRIEGATGELSLYDTVSGLKIIPGAGLFLALAAMGAALLVLRRR